MELGASKACKRVGKLRQEICNAVRDRMAIGTRPSYFITPYTPLVQSLTNGALNNYLLMLSSQLSNDLCMPSVPPPPPLHTGTGRF